MKVQLQSTDLASLDIHAKANEITLWQGRQALRLEDGLALIPTRKLTNASLEVMIGVDGPAYPGIAFRVADVANYELAYAVPHVSGQWDAIQYDPVFHGSNTWQIYHGPSYQRVAKVPTAQWFRFKVDVCDERAAISVDGQSPLVVERLAHLPAAGAAGLWTFRPAYFCDLRVSACDGLDVPQGEMPTYPGDAVTAWFAEGYGVVKCEPNGSLNLNRYLPASMGSVRLNRRFEMPTAGEVAFELGYSDAISLKLGEHEIFAGEYTFKGFADRMSRGYVEMKEMLRQTVEAGSHCLSAELRTSEFFGWGLVLAAHAPGLRWLPAELG